MKGIKLGLIGIVILGFMSSLSAQTWFEIGARGQFGATALYEKGISDNNNHNMNINTGYSFGPTLNVNFSDRVGIAAEVLFAKSEQSYEFEGFELLPQGTNTINWSSTDAYLLFRTMNRGAYLELGPKLSMVKEVEQDYSTINTEISADRSDKYTDQHLAGVLGFGMYLAGNKSFMLSIGFRLEYAFQNFTSDEGESQRFPFPYDTTFESESLRNINAYGAVDLRFPIGGIAKAQCGQRRFIFGR